MFCNEKILKEGEKMPLKIKKSLEKGKSIEKESWNDNNKLNYLYCHEKQKKVCRF